MDNSARIAWYALPVTIRDLVRLTLMQDRGEKCVYLPLRRRTRQDSNGNNEYMLDRITRMEAMLKEANVALPVQYHIHETTQQTPKGGHGVSISNEYDEDNPNHLA